jgi:hypothetical protein
MAAGDSHAKIAALVVKVGIPTFGVYLLVKNIL